jgi:FtsP/CotA-like multicopper oxidase with cupredoxin domain
MTGAFIIEGDYDKQLDGFYGAGWTRKQPVMVINQLGDAPNLERGDAGRQGRGPDFFVNGRANPTVKMKPGEVQLWRILNTSARAGVYFPAVTSANPPGPTDFVRMQLAQDGVQFNAANYALFKNQDSVMASGNRADFLVKAPMQKGSYPMVVRNVVNPGQATSGNPITLFTVVVADDPVAPPLSELLPTDPAKFPLKFPPFLQDITRAEVNGTRKMVFATTGSGSTTTGQSLHTIDGKQFNGEVGEVVLLNRVEEWQIFNATTNIEHPFHIHINPFQVTEVLDVSVKLAAMTGTGTITITSGSNAVTGTDFSKLRVGYTVTAGTASGAIKSINSPTSLTLSNAAAASVSGAYTFVAPKYVADKASLNVTGQCYIDPYQPLEPAVYFPDPAHPDVPKLCGGETRVPGPRIWWDVFPIPLGVAATRVDGTPYLAKEETCTGFKTDGTKICSKLPVVLPGYFKMRSRFVDYPGYFVIHCHILAHEDRGMMTVVEVAPLSSPYSHH